MVTPMVVKHKTHLNNVPSRVARSSWLGWFQLSSQCQLVRQATKTLMANQNFDCQPKLLQATKIANLVFHLELLPLGNWIYIACPQLPTCGFGWIHPICHQLSGNIVQWMFTIWPTWGESDWYDCDEEGYNEQTYICFRIGMLLW